MAAWESAEAAAWATYEAAAAAALSAWQSAESAAWSAYESATDAALAAWHAAEATAWAQYESAAAAALAAWEAAESAARAQYDSDAAAALAAWQAAEAAAWSAYETAASAALAAWQSAEAAAWAGFEAAAHAALAAWEAAESAARAAYQSAVDAALAAYDSTIASLQQQAEQAAQDCHEAATGAPGAACSALAPLLVPALVMTVQARGRPLTTEEIELFRFFFDSIRGEMTPTIRKELESTLYRIRLYQLSDFGPLERARKIEESGKAYFILKGDAVATTLGHCIHFETTPARYSPTDLPLLCHEVFHAVDLALSMLVEGRALYIGWQLDYLREGARSGYRGIRTEKLSYAFEQTVREILSRYGDLHSLLPAVGGTVYANMYYGIEGDIRQTFRKYLSREQQAHVGVAPTLPPNQ